MILKNIISILIILASLAIFIKNTAIVASTYVAYTNANTAISDYFVVVCLVRSIDILLIVLIVREIQYIIKRV